MKKTVLFLLVLFAVGLPAWGLIYLFEGKAPVVDARLPSEYLKQGHEISIHVTDAKTGLRQVRVAIGQQGKEIVLLDRSYPSPGLSAMFSGAERITDDLVVPLDISRHGMADGEAQILVTASDHSFRGWGKGNVTRIEKTVILDSKPPEVAVLTDQHNVERGGSGLIIYKVFEDQVTTGVMVEDHFFPGHAGLFENPRIHACFFALSHLQGPGTRLFVVAEDRAGNRTKRNFNHYIREKRFKTDTLPISDDFLARKMPEFDLGAGESRFQSVDNPLLKKFLYVNGDLRKENETHILTACTVSENVMNWEGIFLRLPGSARMAGFADHRNYTYQGAPLDTSVHLGIDLASLANSPIPAANAGRVILTQFVGIYGNAVIIDHGFGLCSLYSHLSAISVNEGDRVGKGDVIGYTGLTGMAAGDHLHFSMMVHDVFVNPVEWWDSAWITNNITSKIQAVKQMPGSDGKGQ